MQYYLDQQDELDRKNIGLFGLMDAVDKQAVPGKPQEDTSPKRNPKLAVRLAPDKNGKELDDKEMLIKENSLQSMSETAEGDTLAKG